MLKILKSFFFSKKSKVDYFLQKHLSDHTSFFALPYSEGWGVGQNPNDAAEWPLNKLTDAPPFPPPPQKKRIDPVVMFISQGRK